MKINPFKLLDRFLKETNGVAKFCKRIPKLPLGTFSVFILVCVVVSFCGVEKLKELPALNSDSYKTVESLVPSISEWLSSIPGRIIVCSLGTLISIIWCMKWLHRPCALLIAHSSMGHDLSTIERKFEKSYWFIRRNITINLMSNGADEEHISEAVKQQDESMELIYKKNWCESIFYYGVAHTPLVFRLGYQWGQKKDIRFLHRFRPIESAQEFEELPQYDSDPVSLQNSDYFDESNIQSKRCEMLVAIASSYVIKENQLSQIDPTNSMIHYRLQIERYGVDFFNSYQKIQSYAAAILEEIRAIIRQNSIDTIHLMISSSVPFTFYLAQQMHTQQFGRIIVYHYERGKYTWGIDVTEPDVRKCVRWVEDIHP